MMVVVSTSGYFVSVIGPYQSDAQNNDAKILKYMFAHDKEEKVNWVKDGDVFVVDRGFRDSVDFLSDIGIKTEMPAFLKKRQNSWIQNKVILGVLPLKSDGWLNRPTLD